jgi:hypothetical protein
MVLSDGEVSTACGSGRLTLATKLVGLKINRPLPHAVLTKKEAGLNFSRPLAKSQTKVRVTVT